jgi:hypothetical protein
LFQDRQVAIPPLHLIGSRRATGTPRKLRPSLSRPERFSASPGPDGDARELGLMESESAASEKMKVPMLPNALDEQLKEFRGRGEQISEQIAGAAFAD